MNIACLKHIGSTLKYKWFFVKAGVRMGLSPWRVFAHEWCRLGPRLFRPMAQQIHGDMGDTRGYLSAQEYYRRTTPHRWEFWGGKEMPDHHVRELLASMATEDRVTTGQWPVQGEAPTRIRAYLWSPHINSLTKMRINQALRSLPKW